MRPDNFADWFALAASVPVVLGLVACISVACLFLSQKWGERR